MYVAAEGPLWQTKPDDEEEFWPRTCAAKNGSKARAAPAESMARVV